MPVNRRRPAGFAWITSLLTVASLIAACGGGGGGAAAPAPPPLSSDASLSSLSVTGATLDPAFSSAVTSYAASVPNSTTSLDITTATTDNNARLTINGGANATVALSVGDNTITVLVTAENGTSTRTYTVVITREPSSYVKASNTDDVDLFGDVVAMSTDGTTLAVSAIFEDSAATGVNGDETDNSAVDSGAVYVFTRNSGGGWTQQAYVKASNTDAGDWFGGAVALSADGSTLAVGAYVEDSAATGVNGNEADNSAFGSGAAYVFTRDTVGVWTQRAYIKASNTDVIDQFGNGVKLSEDGSTLAVAAFRESSAASGVNGDETDNSANEAGAVYVFSRDSGGVWTQQAYVKASNPDVDDWFGNFLALSADGSTLAVVSRFEDSAATGVNGNDADNSATSAGSAYVFSRDTVGVWTQRAYVKASNTEAGDQFGNAIAMSGDGSTLAVGAWREDSAATGASGDQTNNSAIDSGAVYVFASDSGGVWTQQAYLKAFNTEAGDVFGFFEAISLSGDGSTLAVGAPDEGSAATGLNGDETDNSAADAGAAYVFSRDGGGIWTQKDYVKASNTEAGDQFGDAIAMSGDGSTLAVSANSEDSGTTGVNGDETNNSATDSGAVYIFEQ